MITDHPYPIGSICETYSEQEIEIVKHLTNPSYIQVVNKQDPKNKKQTIPFSTIKRVISIPLPLQLGDYVHDSNDNTLGQVTHVTDTVINVQKSNTITSYNLLLAKPNLVKLEQKSKRGGKREGAGRKETGQPHKKRKAIQLDETIAKNLPDLKQLLQLIQEYRPLAESGTLRSQKLAEFYKKLDSLPTII